MQRKDVARGQRVENSIGGSAKTGKQISAISARSGCGPEAPKTSDGTDKARSTPSPRQNSDLTPTLNPQAWSMSSSQEREAFVTAVGRSEIEDAFNAIESGFRLTRGLNTLNQAWNAATESDRREFYRKHFPANVMNRYQT
jgi:hypothetical protein